VISVNNLEANSVARGSVQIAIANAIQCLVMGIFYIIVTRTGALTQTQLGVLSILLFLASTFSIFTGLALPTALTKFTSENLGKNEPHEAAAIQRTVIKSVLTLSLAGFAIATFFSRSLSQYFWNTPIYTPLMILMFGFAFLSNLLALYSSSLQALRHFGKMAAVILIFIISSRSIAATLALLQLGVLGVLVGYTSGSFIALAAAIAFTHGKFPDPKNNAPIKPLLHYSLPLFLSSLTLLILNQVDFVIIASLTSNYALVGIYYIVVRSIAVLSIIWHPIMVTLFPVLSARYGLQDPQGVSNIIKTASRYLIYVTLPSCIGLAAIAPTALTFFYGSTYAPGAIPLAILSIATIILALYSLFTTTLTAIGKTKQVLKIDIVLALSSMMLLVVLVPFLEAVGAALTRLIVRAISITLAVYALRKEIRVQLDKEAIWKSATASTITLPFLLTLEWTLGTKIPATHLLPIEILTAVCIYLLSLYALKALKSQDFELLRQALPKSLAKYLTNLEKIFVH